MALFDKLKNLFAKDILPGEDRKAYAQAKDLPGFLRHLEEMVTRNEVMLRQIRATISKLELQERATITSVKRGNITGRGVRLALQTVNRYRKQLDGLERKADVINKNLTLHINLIGKIEVMEAMELKGVDTEVIDAVMLEFMGNVEKYQSAVLGEDSVITPEQTMLSENERQELAHLEEEIFGQIKHFKKGSIKTDQAPDAKEPEEEEGDEFEPLPTDDEIRETIEKSNKMMKDMEERKIELE